MSLDESRDPAIRRMSLGALLDRSARAAPDHVAYEQGDRHLTWAELDRRVDHLCAGLRRLGVDKGSRVAVLMYNRLEIVEITLAVSRLGAIAVPLNFRLVPDEVAYILSDSEPKVLVVEKSLEPIADRALGGAASPTVVVVTDEPAPHIPGALTYDELCANRDEARPRDDVPEWLPAFIMYTSGTTGRPKGAVLTHLNLVTAAFSVALATGGSFPDRRLLSVPMFHIAGLANTLGPLTDGGSVIIDQPVGFDPVRTLDLLEREGVTNCFMVPTQWQAVCAVQRIEQRKLSLRLPYWGAAAAPPSVLEALRDTFPGSPAVSAFGQTETSAVTCLLQGDDALRKMGSVGKPVPLVEIRIVNPEMRDVALGEVGEIVYRGPTVMAEYWRNPEATAEAFKGGWFHSGDLCRIDDDGFVYVVDRIKDMIITGGENVYCAEVEAVVDSHPKVAQVAVIGVPHEMWGQTPCAVVVPVDHADPPDVDEIIEHCRDRMASYKKPTTVVIVDDLPRNGSGKVQKYLLRSRFGQEFAGSAPRGIEERS